MKYFISKEDEMFFLYKGQWVHEMHFDHLDWIGEDTSGV